MNSLSTAIYSTPAGAAVPQTIAGQNSRPLQALNERTVSLSASYTGPSQSVAGSGAANAPGHISAMMAITALIFLHRLC